MSDHSGDSMRKKPTPLSDRPQPRSSKGLGSTARASSSGKTDAPSNGHGKKPNAQLAKHSKK